LVWLTVLAAQTDLSAATLKNQAWDRLPGLSALIKDSDDLASLS
jgi:hypothetical protein